MPAIEVVEVLAGADPLLDDGVDLGRRQVLGQRRGRHDALVACLRREVALERDADDVVADPQLEQDLGRRRQQ